MTRKIVSILLILAALFSIAANPLPAAPHAVNPRPLAAPRITVLSPTGETVQPSYDQLDFEVEIHNNTADTWNPGFQIKRETGYSSISASVMDVNPVDPMAPGDSVTLTMDLTVPSTIGTYREIWILVTSDGYVLDRFTWGFTVDGDTLTGGEHPEFSKVTLQTYPYNNFALNLNQTDNDLLVTIKNLTDYDWGAGYYMQRASGSSALTREVTYYSLGAGIPNHEERSYYIDLAGMDHSGEQTATWIIQNPAGEIVGRFSFTIRTTNDSWTNPVGASYAQWTLESPVNQSFLINSTDPDFIVELKNSGNTTWKGGAGGFYLVRKNGDVLAKKGDINFYLPVDVAPRFSTTIIIDLKAPSTAGTYSTIYYFKDAAGNTISEIPMNLVVVNP
jgi:hypothetical protein